jgi:arylsulfatase A-like enzyme
VAIASIVAAAIGIGGTLARSGGAATGSAAAGPPNLVFLLTDDQAAHEMKALPRTRKLIGRRGVSFTRNYVSFPVCCPSRVSFLTGRYMHNHGVRGNRGRLGGRRRFHDLDGEAETLPVWLNRAGYYTVHLGKYLNGYPPKDPNVPRGWDEWYGKTSQYNERSPGYRIYYDYDLYEKPRPGATPHKVHYGARPRAYQTDVLRRKALDVISRMGRPATSPFYMAVNFSAPHAPFIPARRHRGSYRGVKLPRLDAFNERDISDKPRFLRRQARGPIPESQLRITRKARRLRLEQLRSVDQAIGAIVRALRRRGLLRSTYLVFSSDNGAFWGEHRISEGKYLPYDPAARVPLLIRGPGVRKGRSSRELVSNVDFAPTVLQLAGASAPPKFTIDGRSLVPYLRHPRRRSKRPILLEGEQGPSLSPLSTLEQEPAARLATPTLTRAPAYRAVRTSRYLFVRYSSGDVELYDMKRDPQQLRSRHRSRRYRGVRRRLSKLLGRLESCNGAGCARGAGGIGGP